ncbi:MAG: rod shape-determining protein MreC [Pseudomonadota bacterium]
MAAYQDNFFTRGPSPLARATFFSLIAVAVMIADHRFQALNVLRAGVSSVLSPIESALQWPGKTARDISVYFGNQSQLLASNKALSETILTLTAEGQRAKLIATEQIQIKTLQAAYARFNREGVIAEIVRDARNPFSRKIIISRGMTDGVRPGAAVINGLGVVGQVTAVGATSAEVTLMTEKDQAVPVMVVRNGLRAVAAGSGREGTVEMPFIPVAADIQVGDVLVTSGIDGTYPAGLAVATITVVDKNPAFSFARIFAQPTAAPDHYRFVKVLLAANDDKANVTANGAIASKPDAYPQIDVINSNKAPEKSSNKRDIKLEAKRALRDRER